MNYRHPTTRDDQAAIRAAREGRDVPVEKPSTASRAAMAPSAHVLTWVSLVTELQRDVPKSPVFGGSAHTVGGHTLN